MPIEAYVSAYPVTTENSTPYPRAGNIPVSDCDTLQRELIPQLITALASLVESVVGFATIVGYDYSVRPCDEVEFVDAPRFGDHVVGREVCCIVGESTSGEEEDVEEEHGQFSQHLGGYHLA